MLSTEAVSLIHYRILAKSKKIEEIYLLHPVTLFLDKYLRTRNSYTCDKEICRRKLIMGSIICNGKGL